MQRQLYSVAGTLISGSGQGKRFKTFLITGEFNNENEAVGAFVRSAHKSHQGWQIGAPVPSAIRPMQEQLYGQQQGYGQQQYGQQQYGQPQGRRQRRSPLQGQQQGWQQPQGQQGQWQGDQQGNGIQQAYGGNKPEDGQQQEGPASGMVIQTATSLPGELQLGQPRNK